MPKKEKAVGGKQEGGKEEGLALYMFEGGKTEQIKAALRAAVDAVEGEGGAENTEVSMCVYVIKIKERRQPLLFLVIA